MPIRYLAKTTRKQREAIYYLWERQETGDHPKGMTYREFRATVHPSIGCDRAVHVPWCGMWVGVEENGDRHT